MEVNKEIIQRYHLGLCSTAEAAAVKAWLESDQVNMTLLNEEDLQDLEDAGWRALSGFQNREQIKPPGAALPAARTRRSWSSWNIAACSVLLLGFSGYLLFRSLPKHTEPQQAAFRLSYKRIHTKSGQKLILTLPDGTQAWMNSESTLIFPEKFAADQRLISFSGEAYFQVAKNPHKPFIIRSDRTRLQVLGTRFNLRDYAGEGHSSVVVEEGKVRFSGKKSDGHLILTAGQIGTYALGTKHPMTLQTVSSTARYMEWKDNMLVLDNLSLEEIKPILERWYGIQIRINGSRLQHRRYTGKFKNPTARQVMESISYALQSSCREQQGTWIISD